MNILILSAGTRNKVVQYFKKTLNGEGTVVATDCSELAPAIYDADKHYIVPRMTDDGYLDEIIKICKAEKIDGVLSLIDPELSLLSKNEEMFSQVGVKVIGSSYDLCERALDKYEMYKWLKKNGYNSARSYMDKNEAAGMYIMQADKKWKKVGDATSTYNGPCILPMRAYIGEPAAAPSGSRTIGAEFTNIDGTVISLDDVKFNEDDNVYDLQGRRVETPRKGNVYIINGKKQQWR